MYAAEAEFRISENSFTEYGLLAYPRLIWVRAPCSLTARVRRMHCWPRATAVLQKEREIELGKAIKLKGCCNSPHQELCLLRANLWVVSLSASRCRGLVGAATMILQALEKPKYSDQGSVGINPEGLQETVAELACVRHLH